MSNGKFFVVVERYDGTQDVIAEGGLYVPEGKLSTSTLPASLRAVANAIENGEAGG